MPRLGMDSHDYAVSTYHMSKRATRPSPKMCNIKAQVFSKCGHLYQYSLIERCENFTWYEPCEPWDGESMEKVPVEERPYCQECYHKRRAKLIRAHTTVGALVVKGAQKIVLSEAEVVGIQVELQRKLREALYNLDRQCLGDSK